MNYPKAGDLQRETSTTLAGNPTSNPWEVRSSSGLEGVFSQEDDAEFYADELRRSGATDVTARRRPAKITQPRPSSATPNPSSFSAKGERMYRHIKEQYEAKGDPRAKEIAARTVYASAESGASGLLKHQNPPRVLREKWGDASEIVIESNRFGYTGWLESKRGGGRLPISFGSDKPTNAHEALVLARRFLQRTQGRRNPTGEAERKALAAWERLNSELSDLYRTSARERARGYDPYETREAIDDLERREHAAWIAYRDLETGTKSNPDPNEYPFDTDILDGMAQAIWVTSYADWVGEQGDTARKKLSPRSGGEWADVVPASPDDATSAAEDLYTLIERANGKTPGELFDMACQVDGCKRSARNAELFGHYLAMQSMDHGVSWFDDHKEFPLKFARHFEAHSFDGMSVEWSPKVRSTQNGGRR